MDEMRRDKWTFEYGADELAKAAAAKSQHHGERLTWWNTKREEVMATIRESGIDVNESLAEDYAQFSNSASFGPRITVDPTLQSKLLECHKKRLEHDDKRRDYDGWRQLLEANPKARLQLTQDDWLFFFGK